MKSRGLLCSLTAVAVVLVSGIRISKSAETPSEAPVVWKAHDAGATDIAFFPHGDRLVSASLDGTVRIWNFPVGKLIRILRAHEDEVYAVSTDPGGRLIASTGYDRNIMLYDAEGNITHRLVGLEGWSADVVLSPDSRFVAAWVLGEGIRIWETAGGRPARTLGEDKERWGMALTWSPDGRILAAGRATITLWDATSGEKKEELKGHTDFVRDLAFSPDGRRLVSAGKDKTIRIWDVVERVLLTTIESEGFVHYDEAGKPYTNPLRVPMTCVAFSPGGKIVAAGGADRMVRLWDTKTGRLVRTFLGHTMAVTAVAFSPDGKTLVSAGLDKTIRSWPLN